MVALNYLQNIKHCPYHTVSKSKNVGLYFRSPLISQLIGFKGIKCRDQRKEKGQKRSLKCYILEKNYAEATEEEETTAEKSAQEFEISLKTRL